MAAGGSTASAAASSVAPTPTGPCPTPSVSAAAISNPAKTIFCLRADPGNARVTLTWDPAIPDHASQAFFIYYQATDTEVATDFGAVVGKIAAVPDLTNGTTYNFWIARGESKNVVSNVVQAVPATMPDAPTGLTATAGNGQVTLAWAAPASTGGAPISGYDLYVGTAADLSGSAPIARVTGSVVTVVGLANGTTYYFRLTAVNRIGRGQASEEVAAVPVTVPGAPIGLTATAGNGQVTLAWAAPASTGGAPISGYLLYEGTNPGGESGPLVGGQPITTTRYTVSGLTSGTTYYFTVVAVNAAGLSPSSGEASATLPASPPASTPSTTQSGATSPVVTSSTSSNLPPTGLHATAGDGKATLSWATPVLEPGGSPVTGYKIYQATAPGGLETPIGTASGTDVTVPHLNNGTTYYFTVAALSATGQESAQSTEASAKPQHPGHRVPIPASIPKQLIALLAAAGAAVAAVGFTLITRRGRFRSRARHRQRAAAASDVRAVADTTWPDVVSVRDTGREPVHTVRFEPAPGVTTTTIKEGRP